MNQVGTISWPVRIVDILAGGQVRRFVGGLFTGFREGEQLWVLDAAAFVELFLIVGW